MTSRALTMNDPLSRIGQQLIAAAERSATRRKRWRMAVATSAATLVVGTGLGVAAVETDIIGPMPSDEPMLRQHGQDRVDVTTSDGLERPWTFAVYGNDAGGLCLATAAAADRASQVNCGAASIVAEELARSPLNSLVARRVERGDDGDRIVVSGLASPDVRDLSVGSSGGAGAGTAVPLGDALLRIPIERPDGTNGGVLAVRPFITSFVAPPGAEQVTVTAHGADGRAASRPLPVEELAQ